MAETTSLTRTCDDCASSYEVKSRKNPPRRCGTCRPIHAQKMQAARMAHFLNRTAPTRADDPKCEGCGETFERPNARGRKPSFCESCATERIRAAGRAYIAKTYIKRVPGVPEPFLCVDCNMIFEYLRTYGTPPLRCSGCQDYRERGTRNENRRVNGRTDRKFALGERIYSCILCGMERICAETGRPPRFCEPCAEFRKRELAAAISHERRARMRGRESERFTRREIFDRDRWRCGLCGMSIPTNLAWPHPRSASLDHTIPLGADGTHTRANVKASHLRCNHKKNVGYMPQGEQLLLIG